MNQSTLNLESDEPVIIPEGESFQITCSPPFGLPKPTVMWQDVNGKSLQSSASITITNQTLFIKKAQVNQHTGTYVCSAENIADKKQTSFKLIVASKYFTSCDNQCSLLIFFEIREKHLNSFIFPHNLIHLLID